MKEVAVYMGCTEVLEGAGDRLAHLRREIAIWVVWQAVILAALIGELCLKKEILSLNCTRGDCSPDCSADFFFNIVLTLIRRVESAEARSYRLQHKCFSAVLLPGCAIHDAWCPHVPEIRSSGVLHEAG